MTTIAELFRSNPVNNMRPLYNAYVREGGKLSYQEWLELQTTPPTNRNNPKTLPFPMTKPPIGSGSA